jgi:hypothetical protein
MLHIKALKMEQINPALNPDQNELGMGEEQIAPQGSTPVMPLPKE